MLLLYQELYVFENPLCSHFVGVSCYKRKNLFKLPLSSVCFFSKSLPEALQSRNEWCESRNIPVHRTDYSQASLLKILNETQATAIISFVNIIGSEYIKLHTALLTACQQSIACKRLIPSEWIGDSETYTLMPRYYASSREPFRQLLRSQSSIKWTLLNPGWLADYFLESSKTYMKPIPGKNPIDPNLWQAYIRGSGDEVQSWTCGRDVGRAVVELCRTKDWVRKTILHLFQPCQSCHFYAFSLFV